MLDIEHSMNEIIVKLYTVWCLLTVASWAECQTRYVSVTYGISVQHMVLQVLLQYALSIARNWCS